MKIENSLLTKKGKKCFPDNIEIPFESLYHCLEWPDAAVKVVCFYFDLKIEASPLTKYIHDKKSYKGLVNWLLFI